MTLDRKSLVLQLDDLYAKKNAIRAQIYGGHLTEQEEKDFYAEMKAVDGAIESIGINLYHAA